MRDKRQRETQRERMKKKEKKNQERLWSKKTKRGKTHFMHLFKRHMKNPVRKFPGALVHVRKYYDIHVSGLRLWLQ